MDDYIRLHAAPADRMSVRRKELGGRQANPRVGDLQGKDSLDAALAVRARSHDGATVVVPDSAGKDLTSAGGIAVDQDNQRNAPGPD